jgi:hypothetical protein
MVIFSFVERMADLPIQTLYAGCRIWLLVGPARLLAIHDFLIFSQPVVVGATPGL